MLPSKVEFLPSDNPRRGEVVITPCYHGYGTTLGNALRRVLLSSLPGAAVEHFKIRGVQHEFGTVEGVKEDVVEIMLNLKQLAVSVHSEEPVTLTLHKKGPGGVFARDITPNAQVDIVNGDLLIATLTKPKTLELEITVGRGRGYQPVEEKDRAHHDLGTMVVDSLYTPVRDVGYKVEFTRVGDITNYEKLTLAIETNGTITPHEALRQSTQILMDHFSLILGVSSATAAAPAAEANPPEEPAEAPGGSAAAPEEEAAGPAIAAKEETKRPAKKEKEKPAKTVKKSKKKE